ncbi:MAG: 16S rRNA (cytosine(1402)-N(4))-methyltransferase RsmH [Microthrixaceae bacterium]|nr:16S rRNA (cytosine(1402)-N(4))-methyltransferase RsmH [Microthrixaceae bacterium]
MSDPRPFTHVPVMVDRVIDLFAPVPAGTVVDTTLGGASHSAALLDAREDLRILGIDRDPQALAAARARLARFGPRAEAFHARSDQLAAVVAASGAASQSITGVFADLGVSSPQFDDAERGFSYRHDAPLDMRMDQESGPSAADLVNTLPEAELARLLRRNADERFASRIAKFLVAARPVTTTGQLRDVILAAIPAPARRTGGHPAKRTFQALRIAVNQELDVLGPTLDAALDVLAPGGRLVVISYHSGEDRIVKARFRTAETGGCTCPPGLPCGCGAVPVARLLKRGGWVPDASEINDNPRASSARLRAVEKLP